MLVSVCEHRPTLDQPGVMANQMVMPQSLAGYSEPLRRVTFVDLESANQLVFLTNRFGLAATTIASLYKHRRQIELISSGSSRNWR